MLNRKHEAHTCQQQLPLSQVRRSESRRQTYRRVQGFETSAVWKVIKLVSCAPALKELYNSQIHLWGSAKSGQVTVVSHCFYNWSPSRRQRNDFFFDFSFCVSVNFHYWATLKGRGYLNRTLASQFNFTLRAFGKTSLWFFSIPPCSENWKEVSHYPGNCNIFISFTWNSSCYSVSLNWGTAGGSYWRAFALKCTWKPSLIGSHLIWLWYGTSSRAWALSREEVQVNNGLITKDDADSFRGGKQKFQMKL